MSGVLPLSTADDENWLSEFLCFVRSQCVEVFKATKEDLAARMDSKKVLLDQVGIRCQTWHTWHTLKNLGTVGKSLVEKDITVKKIIC